MLGERVCDTGSEEATRRLLYDSRLQFFLYHIPQPLNRLLTFQIQRVARMPFSDGS